MTYADRLRAAGCDEDTVARYVFADTMLMFANRERYAAEQMADPITEFPSYEDRRG